MRWVRGWVLDCGGSRFGLSTGSPRWVRFRRYEREASYVLDGDLHIQIWPIQNVGMELCHMRELYGRDVSKLRKIDERHKDLTVGGQQPESVPRDKGYTHFRKDFVWAERFHRTAPGQKAMFTPGQARS